MLRSIANSRVKSFLAVLIVYILAGAAGIAVYRALPYAYWQNLLIADVAATALVFLFSLLFGNASVYDPYWSVAPVVMLFALVPGHAHTALSQLHFLAVCFWGVRLTLNWASTFRGLCAQDWRYTMLQEKTGRWYPLVNFFGIHLFPTVIVYLCMLPAVYAAAHRLEGGRLSGLFVLLSFCAAVMQGIADLQMHAFHKKHGSGLIRTGLWTYSRHPNYLGEILMWWGMGLSVFCVAPDKPWLLAGALANTAMFLFVSIPMADRRQARKPGYEEYREQTRMLLPFRPR